MSKFRTMTPDEMRAHRADQKLTQQGLADLLEVDLRTVQKWEGGERAIPGPAKVALIGFKLLMASTRPRN